MNLYEILAKGIERQLLNELQTSAIDQELDDASRGIGAATAARSGEMPDWNAMAGAGDPNMDPGMGEPGMGGPGGLPQAAGQPGLNPDPNFSADDGLGGEEELETKKIDDTVLSQVKGMNFWNYEHKNSTTSPEKILQMNLDDLHQLHGAVTNASQMYRIGGKIGMYSDPTSQWYNDFLQFVDKVLSLKKSSDQPVKKKRQGKTAKWDKKKPPKNNKHKKFKNPSKPKGK